MTATDHSSPAALGDVVAALDDPLVDVFGMIVEAHSELSDAVAAGLRGSVDLPIGWVGVLVRLARSPEQRLRMSELARDMTMSNSGLTRLVDRIEAAGHVRREACPEDGRGLHAVLTPAGMEAVAAAVPGHLADLRSLIGTALGPAEIAELTDLLRRVRDRAREASTAS